MTRPLILALDIGTSSVRAALYDHVGNVLPETMVKHERLLESTDDGGAELDAKLAFAQVVDAIDDTLGRSETIGGEITHVAASAFWHSLLGIDAKGNPTTKVMGWADTRSHQQVALLRNKLDEKATHSRTGARFHSSYWPAKLLWLRKDAGARFRATTCWLSLSDYILFRLSGKVLTGVSMASGTGIFDQRYCKWDADLLRFLEITSSKLPALAADQATVQLTRRFAKRWPQLAAADLFPAVGDGAANNIGAGCTTSRRAALMIGTSGAIRVVRKGEPPDELPSGLWCYRVDRQRVIIGGAISDGGGLYHWLKDNLNIRDSDDEVEESISNRKPAGHGLTFLPFVAGERSTGYHEDARGAIVGLHSSTEAIDIVQAAFESVAYRFAEMFDQLKKVAKIKEIVASGGALRESPVWTQIIADVLGSDLSVPDVREASSRGAVLLALQIIHGESRSRNSDQSLGKEFKANPKLKNVYQAARKIHSRYYDNIIDS